MRQIVASTFHLSPPASIPGNRAKPQTWFKWLTVQRSLAFSLLISLGMVTAAVARDDIPDRLFPGQTVPDQLPQPPSAVPDKDLLVPPPQELKYFPIRKDGQPYVLVLDSSVNLTDAMNRFYYDPDWRGEVWSPLDLYTIVEKAQRLMGTWPEYNAANQFRIFSKVNQKIERWSGFGP